MELDITVGTWTDGTHKYKISELVPIQDTILIRYSNLKTLESHCMSVDIFLQIHEACGNYITEKTS